MNRLLKASQPNEGYSTETHANRQPINSQNGHLNIQYNDPAHRTLTDKQQDKTISTGFYEKLTDLTMDLTPPLSAIPHTTPNQVTNTESNKLNNTGYLTNKTYNNTAPPIPQNRFTPPDKVSTTPYQETYRESKPNTKLTTQVGESYIPSPPETYPTPQGQNCRAENTYISPPNYTHKPPDTNSCTKSPTTDYTHVLEEGKKTEYMDEQYKVEMNNIIDESLQITRIDEPDLLDMNNLKFPKPRIKKDNTYKLQNTVPRLERLHQICRRLDNNEISKQEEEYYEDATDFVINKGTKKLLDRNKRATTKKNKLKRELSEHKISEENTESNTIEFKAGKFRKITCTIGTDKQIKTQALIDTGSSHSIIGIKTLRKIDYLQYEKIRMKMNTAGARHNEENVIAKTEIKITVTDNRNIDRHFKAKMLVLIDSNNNDLIIGSDILFNQSNSTITNDIWSIEHDDSFEIIEIPLQIVPLNTQTKSVRIENTSSNKTHIRTLELNCLPMEDGSSDSQKQSPEDKLYEDSFEEFLTHPPNIRNATIQSQSATTKNFSESLKQIHEENKNHVLPDNYCENILPEDTQTILNSEYIDEKYTIQDIKMDHIPEQYRGQLLNLCKKYEDIFAKNNFDMGKTSLTKHTIEVESIPPYQKKRFMSEEKEEFAIQACRELEKNDIICETETPQTVCNLVLVPKFQNYRDSSKAAKLHQDKQSIKKFRLALDFRLLNEATIQVNRTNSVNIDDFINRIKGKIVSQLDLTQAFFAIELDELSQDLTAFFLKDKKYKWKRLSQGLIGAPATFEKLMRKTFSDETLEEILRTQVLQSKFTGSDPKSYNNFLQRYVDDLFPSSDTYEDHLIHLELIFIALRKANLKLSPKKCVFLSKQIKVLGYILDTNNTELFLDEKKAKGILAWDTPNSLYELQSRLYSISYFTKFLPQIKRIIYPLIHLLRTKQFSWTEIEQNAWEDLKTVIAMDIRLTVPDKNEQLFLFTDSSKLTCGQILFVQRTINGKEQLKVVGCNSQIYNYLDSRKNIFIREGLSLVIGIKKFRPYLEASNKPPILFTDCKSLIYNGRTKDHNLSSAQISNFLAKTAQELNFSVFHCKGQHNFLADLFSRSYQNSRLLGEPTLSKQQAENIPPIPDYFSTSSDTLYQFLCSPLQTETGHKTPKKKTLYEKPTQSMLSMLRNLKPEQRAISETRLMLQNNDKTIRNELTHQINQKECKTLKHFADKAMCNHFEITDETDEYTNDSHNIQSEKETDNKTKQGKNSLTDNYISHSTNEEYTSDTDKTDSESRTGHKIYGLQRNNQIPMYIHSELNEKDCDPIPRSPTPPHHQHLPPQPGQHTHSQTTYIYTPEAINNRKQYENNDYITKRENKYSAKQHTLDSNIHSANTTTEVHCTFHPHPPKQTNSDERNRDEPNTFSPQPQPFLTRPQQHNTESTEITLPDKPARRNEHTDRTATQATETKNIYIDKKIYDGKTLNCNRNIDIDANSTLVIENEVRIYGQTHFKITNTIENIAVEFNPLTTLYESRIKLRNDSDKRIHIPAHTELCRIHTEDITQLKQIDNTCHRPTSYFPPHSIVNITDSHTQAEINNKEIVSPNDNNELFKNNRDVALTENLSNLVGDSEKLQQHILKHNQEILNDDYDQYIENIKILQENDDFCNKVRINWPNQPTHTNTYPYKEIDEILYRKHNNKLLLVVPKILIEPLIYHLHQKLCHPSHTLLYQYTQLYYFSPNITKIINRTEQRCFTCMTIKPSVKNTKKSGNKRTFNPKLPREGWSIDLVMNLPQTKRGKTGYLLATCICSRYCCAYPIANKSQSEIYSAILQHITNYGCPKLIYSDADTALIKPVTEIQKLFMFHYTTSAPHTQQANLIENSYKTLKTMITREIYDEKNPLTRQDWDIALAYVIEAYNKLPLKKMNYTKEEVFFRFSNNNTLYRLQENEIKDEIVSEDLRTYLEQKGENRPKLDKEKNKYTEGQIIYIKHDIPPTIGTNQSYKQTHRGPLLIIENEAKARYVIARELSSAKYFTIAYDRIILIKNAYDIPILLSQAGETELYKTIKRANTKNQKSKLKLNSDLSEKYKTTTE